MSTKRIITYCIFTIALLLGGATVDALLIQLNVYTQASATFHKTKDVQSECAYSQQELASPGFGSEPVRSRSITQPVSVRGGVFLFSQILHTSRIALNQLLVVNQDFVQHKSTKQLYGYYLFSIHKILI